MSTSLKLTKQALIICCFLFFILAGFISCQKDLSTETAGAAGSTGSTAVFSLVPSGSNCSDATISGVFQAGKVLMTDSKLMVTVTVTKAGTWTYTTNTVNGFVFKGSGSFTTTGSQVITLQASGTPLAAGNSSFSLVMGTTTCGVSITVISGNSGSTTDASAIYYKATIGGVNYSQSVTEDNGYEAGSGMGGDDDVSFSGGVNYKNPPVPTGYTEFGVGKGIMHHYQAASNSDFKAFFAPGDYSYAISSFSLGDGVTVSWTDPTGSGWETRNDQNLPLDQTGSTFKIISATDAYDIVGNYYIKVKIQFSCKLYNAATGAMKPLTNGEAVVSIGKL